MVSWAHCPESLGWTAQRGWGINPFYRWGSVHRGTQLPGHAGSQSHRFRNSCPLCLVAKPCRPWPLSWGTALGWACDPGQGTWPLSHVFSLDRAATVLLRKVVVLNADQERAQRGHLAQRRPQRSEVVGPWVSLPVPRWLLKRLSLGFSNRATSCGRKAAAQDSMNSLPHSVVNAPFNCPLRSQHL